MTSPYRPVPSRDWSLPRHHHRTPCVWNWHNCRLVRLSVETSRGWRFCGEYGRQWFLCQLTRDFSCRWLLWLLQKNHRNQQSTDENKQECDEPIRRIYIICHSILRWTWKLEKVLNQRQRWTPSMYQITGWPGVLEHPTSAVRKFWSGSPFGALWSSGWLR